MATISLKKKPSIERVRRITLLMFNRWKEKGVLINIVHLTPLTFEAQIKLGNKISKKQKFLML